MKSKTLILAAVLASAAMGQTVTLHMNEVPTPPPPPNTTPPLDGLTVAKGGIVFTFSNPASLLLYDAVFGPEQYVGHTIPPDDPNGLVITGHWSTFSVGFSVPVSFIQFGFAVTSLSPVATMATLTLFHNGTQLGPPITLGSSQPDQQPLTDPNAEVRFTYNGALGPVTSMTITPIGNDPLTNLPIFANVVFDELTITAAATTPVGTPVPAATPLTLALTAICLAGLTMLLVRQRPA